MVITGLESPFPLIQLQVYDGGLVELLGDRLLLRHELGQMMDGALLSKLCHLLCRPRLGWSLSQEVCHWRGGGSLGLQQGLRVIRCFIH